MWKNNISNNIIDENDKLSLNIVNIYEILKSKYSFVNSIRNNNDDNRTTIKVNDVYLENACLLILFRIEKEKINNRNNVNGE